MWPPRAPDCERLIAPPLREEVAEPSSEQKTAVPPATADSGTDGIETHDEMPSPVPSAPPIAEPQIKERSVECNPPVSLSSIGPEEQHRNRAASPSEERPKPDASELSNHLSGHHLPVGADTDRTPLSLRQLQQALDWKQSEVQRMMTKIFGPRPFATYKRKCREKTIGGFLNALEKTPNPPTLSTVPEAISDRMFCLQIAQSGTTESPEEGPSEDYPAYFQRLAKQGIPRRRF